MSSRILSGMRPTGDLHLGNYFGAIKQFLDLQNQREECFFFVADIHALTEVTGPTQIDSASIEVVKNYLACGIDPAKSVLYRQSDVPEVSEIAVLLGNIITLGRLKTCTTFKDRVKNKRIAENAVSYGLLGYPILMASDILCVRADKVPVGQDQIQHVEMARDFAKMFNNTFGKEVFVIPQLNVSDPIRVPGIDGSDKMGKSDGNTIALLEDISSITKKVKSIPTQTEAGGDMQPGTRALYILMQLCSPANVHEEYLARYDAGASKFFGGMKQQLAQDIVTLLCPIQERYGSINDDDVRDVLAKGAKKVRSIAASVLEDMQSAIGIHTTTRSQR